MAGPDNKNPHKIAMYKLVNRLKGKLGLNPKDDSQGFLAPEKVEEADKLIQSLCVNSEETIRDCLTNLTETWKTMQDMPAGKDREGVSRKIFLLAHEIKDIGAMCGYTLVAYFAESLRDYIDQTELNIKAQKIIIQAHIDAMQAAMRQGLKEDGGPIADELKSIVKVAIDKYK
jgi:chemotaxis protein histidine kinase CheA